MITQEAYAKINISLYLGDQRKDGYHDIDTVMQTIALSDKLSVMLSNEDELIIDGKYSAIHLNHDNIIIKALNIFREYTGTKNCFKINLTKNIPFGAGLAGGSSDAMTALHLFSKICDAKLSNNEFLMLAEKLGSDVPFFLYGGTVRATGRGEILEVLTPIEHFYIVIVKPDFTISTAQAYKQWDDFKSSSSSSSERDNKSLYSKSEYLGLFNNDFEKALFPKYPQLSEIKNRLIDCGSSQALLTGSGSCVCGFFKQKEKAQKTMSDKILLRFGELILTETIRTQKL